jgi:hypothetical protein
MSGTPLTHNPLNGVTAGVWREGGIVRKLLTRRRAAPEHWAASSDPQHWNYWRREALVYRCGLPGALGLAAPRLVASSDMPDGDVELLLEDVAGRHGGSLTVADVEAAAAALGRSQGRADRPSHAWLSHGFLRAYSGTRPADWTLLDDDEAWGRPLVREHVGASLRTGLRRLHAERGTLLGLMERLPRAVCHLDVWPNNLIRRPSGEVVFLDWSFVGDGAVGEDVGNLVPDCVFDLLLPHEALPELDARLTAAYIGGLREAGWRGDERVVRLGICASAVKYDWLTARTLADAAADRQLDYGQGATIDPHARFRARAAGLALCAAWAEEAVRLARIVDV